MVTVRLKARNPSNAVDAPSILPLIDEFLYLVHTELIAGSPLQLYLCLPFIQSAVETLEFPPTAGYPRRHG